MDARKDNAIRQKYSASLMSNHKWKKLFTVMAKSSPELCNIEYHFTDTENVFYGSAPLIDQIWNTAIDDPVRGVGGPVEYKHIEYLSIPYIHKYRTYENSPLKEKEQDITTFIDALNSIGEFPITKTETSIIIYGYK